jgi:hypothetical protein
MRQVAQHFVDSPFALTASRHTSKCWSGRRGILDRLHRLCNTFTTRSDSSLDLLWANLGAGKTHALLHLMVLLEDAAPGTVTAYVEMPDHPRRFIDLYRRMVPHLVADAHLDALAASDSAEIPDLRRALRAYRHGNSSEKELALEWLIAGKPQLRDLRASTGIGTRIEDDTRAADILADLVSSFGKLGKRVVILVDEFQRINSSPLRNREGVLANLRSVFSANGTYFSAVLAVTSRIESSASSLLPPELRTLTGVKPAISLPGMSKEEAKEFIAGRFACFRPAGYNGDPFAPIGEDGIESIVTRIAESGDDRLIPRTLLQLAGLVYDEMRFRNIPVVTSDVVREVADTNLGDPPTE